ncbi:twin-arginine translocation pathway signal [Mycobacterium yunnanensis]|uniref:Twin-arginine translocation pathway signal n=1 Tax=Mycobacterium yunnanensis TaxID=368477 RepID=A0A9X3BV89_9MYCO|nr:twin-arginine translocation pathway signal [Mycobacterium yunnanensis]MCV7423110.1 twin-arginine translocation pathway signal [Mycobacterium yunnanensis]
MDGVDDETTADASTEAPDPQADADESTDVQSEGTVPQRRGKRLVMPIVLAALLIGSAGLTAWVYVNQFRPDRETNASVANDVIKAASDGSIAMLSYAPESMDKDFTTAKSHLTGGFLDYYSQFTHDIVTPAVRQKAVKTSATVVQSAVSELKPGSAVVLVFLNQTTTSKENPAGSFTASSVKVGLTDVGGNWLISSFDPV